MIRAIQEEKEPVDAVAPAPLVLLGDGCKAPVPVGMTPERAAHILREMGSNPVLIQHPDGTEQPLSEAA